MLAGRSDLAISALLQVEASRACYYILTRSPLIMLSGIDVFLMGCVSFYKTNILNKHSIYNMRKLNY
jgi:hypothetical protein